MRCRHCGITKPPADYSPGRLVCRACRNETHRQYRLRKRQGIPAAGRGGQKPYTGRRFPLEPLLAATVPTVRGFALAAGVARKTVHRARARGGLTVDQAEDWAAKFGMLPFEVWDDWYGFDDDGYEFEDVS